MSFIWPGGLNCHHAGLRLVEQPSSGTAPVIMAEGKMENGTLCSAQKYHITFVHVPLTKANHQAAFQRGREQSPPLPPSAHETGSTCCTVLMSTTVCPSAHKILDSLSSFHEKLSPFFPEGAKGKVPYRALRRGPATLGDAWQSLH